ncbi:uncharacterized protein LOC132740596 [Ruditapes philippinarum]|uniref:uncharacterized protein LOC132740596 n=1 Tax=Ruditapes philippinarum TaxID=129788 RepID=UPI00295B2D66|nr:uncharacterized protein LOC132740596 [Ruditapes philippinarum]
MTINFTVVGSTVKIKFGPVQHNYTYRVCLATVIKEYNCYKDIEKTEPGQDNVVFTDVEPDTYRIYVQKLPDPDNPMIVTKPFNVSEPPLTEKTTIAASTVAIITMACLLFVAGVTTLYFCLKRKRCQCSPMNWKICNCASYQRTPQSAPNNRAEDEENSSMLEILPVYYDESESFTSAVKEVCSYLNKWAKCRINHNWLSSFYDNPELSFKESYPNGTLLIFLSSKMWTFLNSHQHSTDLQTKIFKNVLMESSGKEFRKMIVSFHPLPGLKERFHCIKIYRIRKQIVGHNDNRFDINTEDLYQMLKEINGDDEEVKQGWSGYEQILSLFNATKFIPENDLDFGRHSFLNGERIINQKNIQNN